MRSPPYPAFTTTVMQVSSPPHWQDPPSRLHDRNARFQARRHATRDQGMTRPSAPAIPAEAATKRSSLERSFDPTAHGNGTFKSDTAFPCPCLKRYRSWVVSSAALHTKRCKTGAMWRGIILATDHSVDPLGRAVMIFDLLCQRALDVLTDGMAGPTT